MNSNNEKIIKMIEEICFKEKNIKKKSNVHKRILVSIYGSLRMKGHSVRGGRTPEYKMVFRSRKRRGSDDGWVMKKGRIDIVAKKNEEIVLVEYDTGTTIKYKSVEKMLQKEADIRIAIITGKKTWDNEFTLIVTLIETKI
ncbi:MAG: hypothetical protein ACTSPV_11075 [Candidatus Hodarchaeales archaeon]